MNVVFNDVDATFILEHAKYVLERFPNLSRLAIRFGLILDMTKGANTLDFRFMYPSGNTSMHPDRPFFLFSKPTNTSNRLKKMAREVINFDSDAFLDSVSMQMCGDSNAMPSSFATIEYLGVLFQ